MRRWFLPFGSQIVLFLLGGTSAQAAEPLFDGDTLLEIELHGPLRATLQDKERRGERHFDLVHDSKKTGASVRVRGSSRAELCQFPPLRLDFSRSETRDTPFEGLAALKLVTHCRSGKSNDQNVVEEYLAYRLFQFVSDTAYRARLLRVTYVDTDRPGRDPLSRFAVAIEPDEDLAERLGGDVLWAEHVKTAHLDMDQAALLFVFQFLIGNTDWSLVRATGEDFCCHNVRLLELGNVHTPVPYDFDQAGIVNAAYARPHPGLRLRTVRTRRYRGNCLKGLDLESAVRRVAAAEAGIRSLVAGLPGATPKQARRRLAYFDEFFEEAREPGKLAAEFERRCVD